MLDRKSKGSPNFSVHMKFGNMFLLADDGKKLFIQYTVSLPLDFPHAFQEYLKASSPLPHAKHIHRSSPDQ